MNAVELELVLAKIERLARQDGKRTAATLDEIAALAREAVGKAVDARLAEGRAREYRQALAKRLATLLGLGPEAAEEIQRDWSERHYSLTIERMRAAGMRPFRGVPVFHAIMNDLEAIDHAVGAAARTHIPVGRWIDPLTEAQDAAREIDARERLRARLREIEAPLRGPDAAPWSIRD